MPIDTNMFVSDQLHEREVELADGKKHKFWFREAPSVDFRRFQIAETSGDDDVRVTSMFRLLASSVCDPDGKLAMTTEQAQKLKPEVAKALFTEILNVNNLGGKVKNG